jgi:oxygen-independent coproporphyrinogen III oxidase
VQAGKLPVYRALTPNADERLIREFILQLKLGRTECDYFQQKFGVDVRQRFAQPLQRCTIGVLAASRATRSC